VRGTVCTATATPVTLALHVITEQTRLLHTYTVLNSRTLACDLDSSSYCLSSGFGPMGLPWLFPIRVFCGTTTTVFYSSPI